jgi:hypothetical protein
MGKWRNGGQRIEVEGRKRYGKTEEWRRLRYGNTEDWGRQICEKTEEGGRKRQ